MTRTNTILFSLIFFAVSIIVSLWSLFVYRNSILIFVLSIVFTFVILKKFSFKLPEISKSAIAISILVVFLATYPYLFINSFVDASADPASHISSLAIGETLPTNYGSFSSLEYRYQIGFPLFAKMFIDITPFVSSNNVVWFLGALFTFFSAILIYLLSREIFGGEKEGLIAIVLFIGSKIIFQNMYWGQYTFMLASVLFLATFLAFYKKSPLAFLFFPAIIVVHPGVTFYALIFFGLWFLVYKDFLRILKLFASGLIVLPVFFINYIQFILNSGAEETIAFTFERLIENLSIFPFWIGVLIFVLAIMVLGLIVVKKVSNKMVLLFAVSFLVSGSMSILLSSTGRILGGRIIELSMFSALFLSVFLIKYFLNLKPKFFVPVFAIILLISLGLFISSNQLEHLRNGSKITLEETDFAYAFKEFDSEYKDTLFLIERHGKIAEVSQKIPFDVMSSWYLNYSSHFASNDPFYSELLLRHELVEKIRNEHCVDCITQAEFDYLVSKNDFFSTQLGLKKVFEYPPYMVFSK